MKHQQRGAILIITMTVILAFTMLVGLVINRGYSSVIRSEIQTAADTAAFDGASMLCSKRVCWNMVLLDVLDALDRQLIHGPWGTSTNINARPIIEELEAQMVSQEYVSGPDGRNVWELDGDLRITVQRGRWWPRGFPDGHTVDSPPDPEGFPPADPRFENIDSPEWNAAHPGVPPFLPANAVRVIIERRSVNMVMAPFDGRYRVIGDAIALAAKDDQNQTCIAPFAVTLCSLLNASGEFFPGCHFERVITESNRYCPEGDPDCNVMPGFWWAPLTDIYCSAMPPPGANQNDLNARCECAKDPSKSPSKETKPCNESAGAYNSQCDFFPYPLLAYRGKHFGMVGLPVRPFTKNNEQLGLVDENDEELFRRIIRDYDSGSPAFCLNAKIGDHFLIKPDGFVEAETDEVLWKRISGQYGIARNPLHVETDLNYSWFISRMRDDIGFPAPGPNMKFFKQLQAGNYIEGWPGLTMDKPIVEAGACAGRQQWGACNSHRVNYDNRCLLNHRDWMVPAPPGDVGDAKWGGNRWYDENGWSYPDPRPKATIVQTWQGYPVFDKSTIHQKSYEFDLDPTVDPWNCDQVPLYTPCTGVHHENTSSPPDKFYTPENTRVWNIAIAVIADMGATASPCMNTITGVPQDPPIDPAKTGPWEVIGFIPMNFFDVDVGNPPPEPPGTAAWPRSEYPPVCDYSTGRQPWAFNPSGAPGGERGCNVIRARTTCKPGLIASEEFGETPKARQVRIVS